MNATPAEMTRDADLRGDWISLSDPDLSENEIAAVGEVLHGSRLASGPITESFERRFALWTGRDNAIAAPSGTMGLYLALKAMGLGPGDEVLLSAFAWRETGHAVSLTGAWPVFVDVNYWTGSISPEKAAEKIGPATRALIGANCNGHPAAWPELRALADMHGLFLIEDCSEAIGSRHQAGMVGSFGDVAIFDFAQPAILCCGEGGMIVTDDIDLAMAIRRLRSRNRDERGSVSATVDAPFHAVMSDLTAALGLVQLTRIDLLIERRRLIQNYYARYLQSFEGIKDPYVAPEVEEVNWFLYTVHLGTRFTRSSRDAIIDDLATEEIEAAAYSVPLHLQRHYRAQGWKKGDLFVTEKLADRAISLPFHAHITEEQVAFIAARLKDACTNLGAGAAIY